MKLLHHVNFTVFGTMSVMAEYVFDNVNPLKCSGVRSLHLEVFSAIQVEPTFLISDIRALWRSGLSARVPECQKLKMKVRPGWPRVTS